MVCLGNVCVDTLRKGDNDDDDDDDNIIIIIIVLGTLATASDKLFWDKIEASA